MFKRILQSLKRPSARGKKVAYLLKLLLSLMMIWLIFQKVDLSLAWGLFSELPLWILAALFTLSFMRHYIQINNWRVALMMNAAYSLNKKELWLSYFVGQPLRFLIPGGPASFAKIFYVRNTSHLASLVSTVTERLFLTWATWFFAALAAFLHLIHLPLALRLLILSLCALLPLFAAFIIGLKESWRPYLEGYLQAAPRMMSLQAANSLLMYLQYYLLLNAFGSITYLNSFLGMALTNISNSIPITISGLGLREGFAIYFLKNFGFEAYQAVAVTLGLFVFQDVIPALVGLFLLLKHRRIS